MSRRRDPDKPRWVSTKWPGYIESRAGVAYSVLNGRRLSLQVPFERGYKQRALILHEERAENDWKRKNGLLGKESDMMLSDAITEFLETQLEQFSPGVRRWMTQGIRYYLPDDLPLETDTISDYLEKRAGELSKLYKPATRRKHLQYIRRMFRYFVRRKWLLSNPVHDDLIPSAPQKPENRIYVSAEMESIVRDLLSRPGTELCGYYFWLLWLTGMRKGEALSLRRSDISLTAIRIHGKGDKKHPEGKVRHFPLMMVPETANLNQPVWKWQQEIRYVLRQILWISRGFRDERLWTWQNNYSNADIRFRESKGRVGLGKKMTPIIARIEKGGRPRIAPPPGFDGRDGRTVHTIRATAIYRFRTELHLSAELICDMVGHSIQVHLREYRRNPTADELAATIRTSHAA